MILYDKQNLKYIRYGQSMRDWNEYLLCFFISNICKQLILHQTITKLLSNEILELFCVGLE